MAQGTTLVTNYRDVMRAFALAENQSRVAVRTSLRPVGEIIRAEAARLQSPYDVRSATGYKVAVRQTGIVVRQTIKRTLPKDAHHFGFHQMKRALLPALASKADEAERAMEKALDDVADHFNHRGI